MASSFREPGARTIGLGFVALAGGETAGQLFAHSLEATGASMFDLYAGHAGGRVAAVHRAFVPGSRETDLIKIGIGEVSLMGNGGPEEAPTTRADLVDPIVR